MAAPTPVPHTRIPRSAFPPVTRSVTRRVMTGKSTGVSSVVPTSITSWPSRRTWSTTWGFSENPAWSFPTAIRIRCRLPVRGSTRSPADHRDGVAENSDFRDVHHHVVPLAKSEVAARHDTRSRQKDDTGWEVHRPEQPVHELVEGSAHVRSR